LGEDNNLITNSKSAKNRKTLTRFIQNNCLPIILVPGLLGTKLRVVINDLSKLDANIKSDCKDHIELNGNVSSNSYEWNIWPESKEN